MSTTSNHPRSDASQAPTVIFLHIGKTAGSTLRLILRRNYPRSRTIVLRTFGQPREVSIQDFASLNERTRAEARLVYGHTPFGIHRSLPGPATYITMARHPIALVLSQYAFVRRTAAHRLHEAASGMSLEEYIESGVAHEMNNTQSRAIAGDTEFVYGSNPSGTLEHALDNIDSHFALVGLTERFDESLVAFRRRFGWRNIYYAPANVTGRRVEPTRRALELIRAYNENDLTLYQEVCRRFDRVIETDAGFHGDFARFRRRNRMLRPATRAVLMATHTIPRSVKKKVGLHRAAGAPPATSSG